MSGLGLLTAYPRGQWRVVHRLQVPACPFAHVFGGWTVLWGASLTKRAAGGRK